jgi:hypothetical protein
MLRFILTPVRFFESRRMRPPNWVLALSAPLLCGCLQVVSNRLFVSKTEPMVAQLMARLNVDAAGFPFAGVFTVVSSLTYPMLLALAVLAVVCLDVLLKDSRQSRRLGEFTALCFFTHVPYCAWMVLVAWFWVPEDIRIPVHATPYEVWTAVETYRAEMLSAPMLSTARILWFYSMAWLACQLSVSLKVVSGIPVRAAAVVAVALFAGFAGLDLIGNLLGFWRG